MSKRRVAQPTAPEALQAGEKLSDLPAPTVPPGEAARVEGGAVVSKYIGETEKQLGRTFPAASASDSTLLLSDADELFGR
jgi:hypothetical protein